MIDKAVKLLNQQNAELVLHAGDYVAPFVVPRFKELKAKLIGVFGNNDGGRDLLKRKFSENKSLELHGNFAYVTVDGLKIALLHGDEEELLNALIDCQGFDVVVHGHMHKAEAYRKGRTLIVNPGEVCGYLSGRSTIALFDTKTLATRIMVL
jgi:putative phosphoesterase